MNFSFFLCLAAFRTRSSAWDTLSRILCPVRVGLARVPLGSALRSTASAAGCPALFGGFVATMAESTSHARTSSASAPRLPDAGRNGEPPWPGKRSPGSRARSVRTCQGLRSRRVVRALAIAPPPVLRSANRTTSAPRKMPFSRLNGWPTHTPIDASSWSSRPTAHGSGTMWFATPLPWRTSPPTPCRSPGALWNRPRRKRA